MKKSMFSFGHSVTVNSVPEPPVVAESDEYLKHYEGRLGLFCLGGQGSHIAAEAYALKYRFTEIMVLNTDYKDNSKIRENCPGVRVLDIGKDSYEICGSGAGGRPEVAERGFAEAEAEVLKLLKDFRENKNMQAAFVAVGLGGGTGTGLIAPFLKLCREAGIYRTIVLTTMPSLTMHGSETVELAVKKLEEIQELCDGITIVNNEWIFAASREERISLPVIYDSVNKRIANTLGSFIEVMLSRSRQNIDLNDLLNFIKPDENGIARLFVLGKGIGRGENRVIDSVQNALDSFYLVGHGDILGAKALLYHTLTVRGSGDAYPEDLLQLVDYIEERTGTVLGIKKLGGGEADYNCSDPEFTDDAMLQVLLVTDFGKTPLEVFKSDLELEEEAQKERFEARKRDREARMAKKEAKNQATQIPIVTRTGSTIEFEMPEYGSKKSKQQNSTVVSTEGTDKKSEKTAAEEFVPETSGPMGNIFPPEYMAQFLEEERQRKVEKEKRENASHNKKVGTMPIDAKEAASPKASEDAKEASSKEHSIYTEMLNE